MFRKDGDMVPLRKVSGLTAGCVFSWLVVLNNNYGEICRSAESYSNERGVKLVLHLCGYLEWNAVEAHCHGNQ